MRTLLRFPLALLVVFLAACGTPSAPKPSRSAKVGPKPVSAKPDELRLWTDKTPAKLALVAFVEDAAAAGSPGFIPPAERVAVFSEAAVAASPAPALRELAGYLRARGFRVYLVSDRPDADRPTLAAPLGLGDEQVATPYPQSTYKLIDGVPSVVPLSDAAPVAAPVLVHQFAGRRPVLAFGGAAADRDLLDYATLRNPRPSLGLVVASAGSAALVSEAPGRGWSTLSASDWRR